MTVSKHEAKPSSVSLKTYFHLTSCQTGLDRFLCDRERKILTNYDRSRLCCFSPPLVTCPPPPGVAGMSLARICQILSAPFAVSFFSSHRLQPLLLPLSPHAAFHLYSSCVPSRTQTRTHTTSASCSFLSFLIPLHHWEPMTGLNFLEPQCLCFSTTPRRLETLVCRCPPRGIYKGSVRNKTR